MEKFFSIDFCLFLIDMVFSLENIFFLIFSIFLHKSSDLWSKFDEVLPQFRIVCDLLKVVAHMSSMGTERTEMRVLRY